MKHSKKFLPKINWFDPIQLFKVALRVILATVFGQYFDRREMQAALSKEYNYYDYSNQDEITFDYVADIGDGWNACYSIATLLAKEKLVFDQYVVKRGQLLIMGGDQVYPDANRENYQQRLLKPYQIAFPDELTEQSPHLFAVPGNHDWYDGLTAFMRLFCQQRRIAGWRTRQSYSYFAIKLPHRWWLLGIDIQFNADIDKPQLDYFIHIAKQYFQAGDKVILCTAEPSWVKDDPSACHNLNYFEERVIKRYGAELKLTISGDLHHYAHYKNISKQQHKITAGGGGAYLSATHDLPKNLLFGDKKRRSSYSLIKTFPKSSASKRLSLGAILFAVKNIKFSLMLGVFSLVYSWILCSLGKPSTFKQYFILLIHNPPLVVFTTLTTLGWIYFTETPKKNYFYPWLRNTLRIIIGCLHTALLILLTLYLMWIFSHILFIFIVEMLIVGSFLLGTLTGLIMLITHWTMGFHNNNIFASQGIDDYKNFLRLQITQDGTLVIYPVGLKRVVKNWQQDKQIDQSKGLNYKLIETPILIN